MAKYALINYENGFSASTPSTVASHIGGGGQGGRGYGDRGCGIGDRGCGIGGRGGGKRE